MVQAPPPSDYIDYPRPGLRLHVPTWVRFAVWKCPSRRFVVVCAWLAASFALVASGLALAAAALEYFWTPHALLVVLASVPAAWHYFAAIRWLDRHQGWTAVLPNKKR